ncbi:hypothetical protein OG607_20520 [Streptomyces sp. NBC_01537]|uniref:hypothetical protein n=1 Tax=Streptomyces sp. NBC_01537 TaxID=2903896 RepID=UPI00386FA30E
MTTATGRADQFTGQGGWAKETGIPGTFGFGARFEEVVSDLQSALTRTAQDVMFGPTWYPPIMATPRVERSEYAESFPHLLGTVHAFSGEQAGDATEPQGARQPTDVVLAPAVCYNVYSELADLELSGLNTFDASGYCYRHEATSEIGRFRVFRMREFIAVGGPEATATWRDEWIGRCQSLFTGLGLRIETVSATDPFFGPGGRLMRSTQLEQGLKYEFVAKVREGDPGTAIASANRHRDHLGRRFDIRYEGGESAHSSCVAFGLERIALALIHAHGDNRSNWPEIS